MSKILVTGSIAYDLLLSCDGQFPDGIDPDHLDSLSVVFIASRFRRHHGGTGVNIAWNLTLLDQDPLLVGTVGEDGGAYTALLKERGISTACIEKLAEHATSTAIIATDSAEHQIGFYHPGADMYGNWPAEGLMDEREEISLAIISPREERLMFEAIQWCRSSKISFLFDPGQRIINMSKDELLSAIRGSAGVIANAYEWSLLSEKIHQSADHMLEKTSFLIVTHGEEGLTIYERGGTEVIPACKPERLINPTGAGDGLRAGLLTGLSRGWSLREAGRLGASLASFVVEQEGTLIDSLDVYDVLLRAEMTYGQPLPKLS